jgi:hypothetical protein
MCKPTGFEPEPRARVPRHEREAARALYGVLLALARLQAEIVAALATLGPPPQNGR